MTTILFLLSMQRAPYHTLFPWTDPLFRAFTQWDSLTRLYSDYPEVYRWSWSLNVVGPCPDRLHTDGDNPWQMPCDIRTPPPTELQMPAVLYTAYQHLTYTAPEDPDYPKARLSLSYKHVLTSAGVIWELSVDSEGLTHDIFWVTYSEHRKTIFLSPLMPLQVKVLRPSGTLHFSLQPNGEWSLEEHEIREWDLPFQYVMQTTVYDVLPASSSCGTVGYRYTTKVAETLNSIMSSLVGDAATVQGEKQIVVVPATGVGNCGAYSYAGFNAFMTHRLPATPSYGQDGPPVEVWSFGGNRDMSLETRQVIHGEETEHQRVDETRRRLSETDRGGDFQRDPDGTAALDHQRGIVQGTYQKSTDLGDQALMLLDLLAADPTNQHLWELFETHIAPKTFRLDHQRDSSIEFDPYQHCEVPSVEGTVPFWGSHFLLDATPDPCHFCVYHDLIVQYPWRSWSHARLLDMEWVYAPIHGARGNLYQHAYRFIRAHIWGIREQAVTEGLTDRMKNLAERQTEDVHQGQIEPVRLRDLETERSETTQNSARARDSEGLPLPFSRDGTYDPCLDPSYTIQYLVLFGEITDIFDAPCDLLWAVE